MRRYPMSSGTCGATTRSGTPLWRLAARVESVGHYLGTLPPGDVILRAEVRLSSNTGFTGSAAWIALHDVARGQTLYISVESMSRRYILEGLVNRYLREASRIRHNLRRLSTSSICKWAE